MTADGRSERNRPSAATAAKPATIPKAVNANTKPRDRTAWNSRLPTPNPMNKVKTFRPIAWPRLPGRSVTIPPRSGWVRSYPSERAATMKATTASGSGRAKARRTRH